MKNPKVKHVIEALVRLGGESGRGMETPVRVIAPRTYKRRPPGMNLDHGRTGQYPRSGMIVIYAK